MSKTIKLNKKLKKNKKDEVKKSPHILDLRQVVKKQQEDKLQQEKTVPTKIFDSVNHQAKHLKKKRIRLLGRLQGFGNGFLALFDGFRVKLVFSQNKFKPKIDKNKKLSYKDVSIIATIKQKKKQQTSKVKKVKKIKTKTSIIKPFFTFQLKHSIINMTIFVLFISVLILPIKGFAYKKELNDKVSGIMGYAVAGAGHLEEAKIAGFETNWETLFSSFDKAEQKFNLAQKEVDQINKFIQAFIKIVPKIGGTFTSGKNILFLGEKLSQVGKHLSSGFDVLRSESNDMSVDQLPTEKLESVKKDLNLALQSLIEAEKIVDSIDIYRVPAEYRKEIITSKKYLPKIRLKLEQILGYLDVVQDILGHSEMKRYLLIFQNNNEIRATGGFIGSYALIDINHGKIKNLEIPAGGSYDLEGGELENVISPQPLWLISPEWHFWDSNWFFDFPTSAEKMIEFYNSSGGPTVDGVISINATLMQELVGQIGQLDVDGYDYVVDGNNFIQLLQEEGNNNKDTSEPKKFLSLIGPVIIERLMSDPMSWFDIAPVMHQGLRQKDIQFYFSSYDLQKEVIDLGWSGRILDTKKDYLAVVHTNLAGGKTDQVIKNEIWHKAEILSEGGIEDTLIITRAHKGELGNIFTGAPNNDYLRVYVPLGSKLISAYGFTKMEADLFEMPEAGFRDDDMVARIESGAQIDELSGVVTFVESGKTVFAHWLHLEPGETKSVYLKYSLPFDIDISKNLLDESGVTFIDKAGVLLNPGLVTDSLVDRLNYYSLLVQKQSGVNNLEFISSIKTPKDYVVSWTHPEKWKIDSNVYKTSTVLDRDMVQVMIFK